MKLEGTVAVDVLTEIVIGRPAGVVAGYAADPSNAAQGPFPMETTYTWQPASDRSTKMTLRNSGEPAGFPRLAAPLMAIAIRHANRKDLLQAPRRPPDPVTRPAPQSIPGPADGRIRSRGRNHRVKIGGVVGRRR